MSEHTEQRTIGRLIPTGGTGTVHVEDVYPTTPADLWSALTEPERLARWIAVVEGDLREGGSFRARFTSHWEGTGRVVACEPPRRLVVVTREVDGPETEIEATLTPEGDGTRLVIEDRGLPVDEYAAHGAGWQVHLEDLAAALAGRGTSDWHARWVELSPAYERMRAAG